MLDRVQTRLFHSVLISDLVGGFFLIMCIILHLLSSKRMNHFLAQDVILPYYMKFWRHVNLAILKNPYLATL